MKADKFTPELRERAARMVLEHRADHLVQIGPSRVDLPEFLMFGEPCASVLLDTS